MAGRFVVGQVSQIPAAGVAGELGKGHSQTSSGVISRCGARPRSTKNVSRAETTKDQAYGRALVPLNPQERRTSTNSEKEEPPLLIMPRRHRECRGSEDENYQDTRRPSRSNRSRSREPEAERGGIQQPQGSALKIGCFQGPLKGSSSSLEGPEPCNEGVMKQTNIRR